MDTFIITTEYYCGETIKASRSFSNYSDALVFMNSCLLSRGYDVVTFKIVRHG